MGANDMRPMLAGGNSTARVIADPYSTDPANAILEGSRIHVWAVVSLYHALRDARAVAEAYEIDETEVEAALTYYRAHQDAILRRLAELRAPSPGEEVIQPPA